MEPESDPVGGLESVEIEIAALGGHFARVDEQRHVDDTGRQPPVFCTDQKQMFVLKPEVRVSPKRIGSTERREKVIRNHLTVVGAGDLRQPTEHENPLFFQKWEVLPDVGIEAPEAEIVAAISKIIERN